MGAAERRWQEKSDQKGDKMKLAALYTAVMATLAWDVALSQTETNLTAKRCIFEAAVLLPAIPGLSIESVRTVVADKVGATQLLLRERAFSSNSAIQFAETFGSMSADAYQRIRSRYASGDYSAGVQLLQDHITAQTETVLRITFKVIAARQEADVSFDCFETPTGLRRVFPRGVR
jgi:hypothetical protein